MLARKWQLPGSDISNTVVKELKFSILQTGYQQNPGKQVNYEKLQEIDSNCHKEPALTFLSKVVAAFRYHQRRHGLYTDALRFLCTYKYVMSGYTVYTACSGKDALKQAGCQPDLVLLDINSLCPDAAGCVSCTVFPVRRHLAA